MNPNPPDQPHETRGRAWSCSSVRLLTLCYGNWVWTLTSGKSFGFRTFRPFRKGTLTP